VLTLDGLGQHVEADRVLLDEDDRPHQGGEGVNPVLVQQVVVELASHVSGLGIEPDFDLERGPHAGERVGLDPFGAPQETRYVGAQLLAAGPAGGGVHMTKRTDVHR